VVILSTSREVTMNNARMLTISTVFSALFVLAVPIVRSQDILKVAPKNCKVLLENDRVRVIRVVTKPGEKIEMHSHPA
jgi:quercetin dioxygenase-like cupin family protein